MTPTDKQRAAMAADLGERAAHALRTGNDGGYVTLYAAVGIEGSTDPVQDYRSGLMSCGLSYDETCAAVAAIADGKHPPDSLPGHVIARKNFVECLGARDDASRWFLSLLGCKVPR